MTDLIEARRQSHELRRSFQYDVGISDQGVDLMVSPDDMMQLPEQTDETVSEGLSRLGDAVVDTGAATGRAVLGGVRDAGQGFLDLTGELAELLESKVPLGYITYGPEGLGYQQEKPEGYEGMQLPEVPRGDSTVENVARGLVQFAAGFAAAPVRGAGMARNMARGGFADALFNPEDGNLSTFLKQAGLENDVINYLDSQVDEEAGAGERLQARLKNTLEGMGLGALIDTTMAGFRAARSDEGIKGTIRNGLINAGDRAQARLDEAGTGTTLTSGVDVSKPIDQGIAAVGRAFDDAQARYFDSGNYEPPTKENPVSVVKPTEQEPGIIAFHGSGADFDEFRLEMIGTGEGAQAYGYGLYFTDSKDIAKFYKEAMEQPKYLELEGKPLDSVYTADNEEKFADYVNRNFDPEEHDDVYVVLDNLGQGLFSLDDADALSQSSFRQGAQKQIYQKIKKDLVEPEVSEGKMYKVGLAPKPDELVDYDLSLNQQPEKIKKVLQPFYEKYGVANTADFGTLLSSVQSTRTIPDDAFAEKLVEAGIPGIKYRAAGSRGANVDAADAEMNYVIFDDKAVKILEKYGIVGPVAVSALAAKSSNDDNEGGI